MKQSFALCTALLLLPMAHGAKVNIDFAGLPKQRVDLGACAFSAPMQPDSSMRLTEGKTPQLANFHGKLIPGKTKRVTETWIQLRCFASTDIESLARRSCIEPQGNAWAYDECRLREVAPGTVFARLVGSNWSGGGVVQTTAGVDWDKRTRFLSFCMVHPPVALCGRAYDLQYEAWPKDNALPYVLKFLQSIEFIDEPAPPAIAASAP